DGMARAYSGMFNNVNLDKMTEFRINSLRDGKCDGAFYHMNRSCKLMSLIQYEMQRQTEEVTKIPSAGFDGDQADPRAFTKAQFETRIQGLVEVMDERKNLNRGEI
ncbi:MAG: 2-hydroxyacyl-CoA dehydratase family protein, partial [Bacilli bacterium]